MATTTTLEGLYAGQVRDRWPGKAPSAIAKAPIAASYAEITGLRDDAQADLKAHGGPGKAIHVYPAQHYTQWTAELGKRARFVAGGFGENISITGWDEQEVCIGDIWRVGDVFLQISQGRQPCWKLSAHVGDDRMVDLVRSTLRTGWYMRVLVEGDIEVGAKITRIERPRPGMTVARMSRAVFDKKTPPAELADLARVPELDESWAKIFDRRAALAS